MLLNVTAGKGLAKLSNNFEVNVSEKNSLHIYYV